MIHISKLETLRPLAKKMLTLTVFKVFSPFQDAIDFYLAAEGAVHDVCDTLLYIGGHRHWGARGELYLQSILSKDPHCDGPAIVDCTEMNGFNALVLVLG